MERLATFMVLKPGMEARYRQEHRDIWPEVRAGISRFGFHHYSIFMHAQELYSYFEVDNLERATGMAVADSDNQRWQVHMRDFFEEGPGIQDGSTIYPAEVFHTDGYTGPLTTVQRVGTLMQLKAGMQQIYKEEHQKIWPEILLGIERAHIRNYSIFLIGRVLFSYFEVEDLNGAMHLLANDPDNQRWQIHMAGLFDLGPGVREGTTLYLDEVFHLD
jgi:L-rhamnose mutarotase